MAKSPTDNVGSPRTRELNTSHNILILFIFNKIFELLRRRSNIDLGSEKANAARAGS